MTLPIIQKLNINKRNSVPAFAFVLILFIALLVNSRDSNILWTLLSVIAVCSMMHTPSTPITVRRSELVLLIPLLLVLSLRCISAKEFVYSYDLVAYILLYFSMKTHADSPRFQVIVVLAFVLTGIYEALYGMVSFQTQNGGIIGHFNNPAGYAVFFAGLTPLAYHLIGSSDKCLKIIGKTAILTFAIAIILSQSRAGVISLLFFYAIILYTKVRNKSLFLIAMLGFTLIIGYFLYEFKAHSANGRLLIWENSLRMISDAPLFGHGFNGFTSKYMLYQAEYFRENPDSPFSLLADDVLHPFSEYLNFIIRYGLITFVLALSSICIACKGSFRDIHKRHLTLSLIVIAVFSLFSYPLEYGTTQLIVIISILFLASSRSSTVYTIKIKHSRIVMIPLVALLLFQAITLYKNNEKCVALEHKTANAHAITEDIVLQYEELEEINHSNPYFLFNYGAVLSQMGNYEGSIALLDKCEKHLNNSQVQLFLTENYINLEQYDKAELHALQASYMYPSLFRPLFYLTTIYDQTGQIDKARAVAQQIIDKPMKVLNFDSSLIKAKMKEYLKNNELP